MKTSRALMLAGAIVIGLSACSQGRIDSLLGVPSPSTKPVTRGLAMMFDPSPAFADILERSLRSARQLAVHFALEHPDGHLLMIVAGGKPRVAFDGPASAYGAAMLRTQQMVRDEKEAEIDLAEAFRRALAGLRGGGRDDLRILAFTSLEGSGSYARSDDFPWHDLASINTTIAFSTYRGWKAWQPAVRDAGLLGRFRPAFIPEMRNADPYLLIFPEEPADAS